MKKIFAVFALFTLFFAVSCGSSDLTEEIREAWQETHDDTQDILDSSDTAEDADDAGDTAGEPGDTSDSAEEHNDSGDTVEEPDDTSDTAEETDDSDSTPDQPNDADSADDSDTSDSDDADTSDPTDEADPQSDDDADTDSGDPDEPCTTIDAKLWWSPKTTDTMDWLSALDYCEKKLNDSNKCGYSDWHLPIIDELKMLLKWRRDSQCKVSETDDHLSFNDYWTCSSCCHDCTLGGGGECNYSSYYYDGRYSKLGDSGSLWSSSVPTEYIHSAWFVNFNAAQVYNKSKSNTTEVYVRCVRGAQ